MAGEAGHSDGVPLVVWSLMTVSALRDGAERGRTGAWYRRALIAIGLFGAALLYGDGMITPAISVLSAVEGLSVATHVFEPFIVPITIVILIALFLVQHRGTSGIGKIFGPIMIVWFTLIAVLGLPPILKNPGILAALNRVW